MKKSIFALAALLVLGCANLQAASPCDSEPTIPRQYHCYRFVEVTDCAGDLFVLDLEQLVYVYVQASTNTKYLATKGGQTLEYCDKVGDLFKDYRNFLKNHPQYLK